MSIERSEVRRSLGWTALILAKHDFGQFRFQTVIDLYLIVTQNKDGKTFIGKSQNSCTGTGHRLAM
jgi:hypothetical protein